MKIKNCRVCSNTNLQEIGSLGDIAMSDFTTEPKKGVAFPLTLVYCDECCLLQLDRNFNRELLYKNYWYVSSLNLVIVSDLQEIAKFVKGDVHIDIGGNDGTLMKFSTARTKLVVDPSNIKPIYGSWINEYFEDIQTITADTITAIACLYDLPDPNKFIRNVKKHLKPDGTFISQFQPLHEMVELNDVGNICHEHLEYYSYRSLVRLFEQNGLEIFKVDKNKMNGGSYRIFARHYFKGSIPFEEKEYTTTHLLQFFKRVADTKTLIRMFVENHEIYGYGASTKGNTIMQYYGVTPKAIIDINPQKRGRFTIATKVPIIDYIPKDAKYLWVFPYGFLDYFKKREKEYAGKWITTIPEFKIHE